MPVAKSLLRLLSVPSAARLGIRLVLGSVPSGNIAGHTTTLLQMIVFVF